MHRLPKQLIVGLQLSVLLYAPAKAQDAPWLKYGASPDPTVRLQKQVGTRAPNALCRGRIIETRSPLDKVVLTPQALAELTPALAQTAGLVSMVADDQRELIEALAVKQLQAKRAWTPAAEQGYFKYLLVQAEEVKSKANASMGVAGAVAGGLGGLLSSGIMNDLGAYGGQVLVQGKEMGSEYARKLRPTTFAIVPNENAMTAVLDVLIGDPCRVSATDALLALRTQ